MKSVLIFVLFLAGMVLGDYSGNILMNMDYKGMKYNDTIYSIMALIFILSIGLMLFSLSEWYQAAKRETVFLKRNMPREDQRGNGGET